MKNYVLFKFVYIWGDYVYKKYDIKPVLEINSVYSAFKMRYPENYYFDGESHDFWELVCILDGKACITAGSKLINLKAGQAVIHPPMEFHRLSTENNSPEIAIFSFSSSLMPEVKNSVYSLNSENLQLILKICENSMLVSHFSEKSEFVEILSGEEMRANIMLLQLEILVLSILENFEVPKLSRIKTQTAKNYTRIANILEENVDKNLSIDDIAVLCSMSSSNVKKTFSMYSGGGVIEYFNTLKIKKAMLLLSEGYSIEDTAYRLGFSDRNYFSTVFKKISGYPPSHYKKSIQNPSQT